MYLKNRLAGQQNWKPMKNINQKSKITTNKQQILRSRVFKICFTYWTSSNLNVYKLKWLSKIEM